MTEQEKREKAIEEMARTMCNAKETCNECVGLNSNIYFRDISDCKCYYGATRAFNAGYRKEEEVRKETIIKFVDTLKNTLLDNKWQAYDLSFQDLKNIAKNMFGVEVEE